MDIRFDNKSVKVFREIYHQTKRIQESAESVVPDTDEDIGRIASVKSSVLLKSKDVTARGVSVTGEATAALLYITDDGSRVSFVRLTKGFAIDCEVPDVSADTVAQIALSVTNTEARIVNPRKVSVTFDIAGELRCYRQEELCVGSKLPEGAETELYARYETREAVCVNAVTEKTVAVSEQFVFPSGKPTPERLVWQEARFHVADAQLIGTKIILKGSAELRVCYLPKEADYPLLADFSAPFSQIVDIGEESMSFCSVRAELTSAFYELSDTINGDKALDTELHAVLQTLSRRSVPIGYVSDAYSNRMPAICTVQSAQLFSRVEQQQQRLSAEERIAVLDDCADVLSAAASVTQCGFDKDRLSAVVTLDILYRSEDGVLQSARRSVSLEKNCDDAPSRILDARLCESVLRPDGSFIDGRFTVELTTLSCRSETWERVTAVTLDEQIPFDLSKLPSVTLVRVEDEDLWELAKRYRSNVERIRAVNDTEGELRGRRLLIPRTT